MAISPYTSRLLFLTHFSPLPYISASFSPRIIISNFARQDFRFMKYHSFEQYHILFPVIRIQAGDPCPKGSFPCGNITDVCVEQRHQCDGTADCENSADEDYFLCRE